MHQSERKMDSFTITLPSNVSNNDSAKNRISSYQTKLAQRIDLDGEWHVGLYEISYTKSWYNIPKRESIELLDYSGQRFGWTSLEPGFFRDGQSLQASIEEALTKEMHAYPTRYEPNTEEGMVDFTKEIIVVTHPKIESQPQIFFDSNSHRFELKFGRDENDNPIFVTFSSDLRSMLGFDKSEFDSIISACRERVIKGNPIEDSLLRVQAKYPAEMRGGYHTLFLYTDIVKPSLVGDRYAQILRTITVPNEAKFGDQCVISYPNPIYFPLHVRNFQNIQLELRDDSGLLIPFQFGRTIVTLHFKKDEKL